MRKVRKFSIFCSQPSGSLLSSVTRDICSHTDILLRMRTLVEFSYIQRQLALVSQAGHLRTHRHFTAHAQRNLAYFAASLAAACSRQSRGTSAHTDNLLRMRKVEEITRKSCSLHLKQLTSVSYKMCARMHFTAHAQICRKFALLSYVEPLCSVQYFIVNAKVKKFSKVCSRPCCSFLFSAMRDICAYDI